MPAGISKAKGRRNGKTRNSGMSRDKAGLPAKAGKRKLPTAKHGKHITTEDMRSRAMWLHSLGHRPYVRPAQWRAAHEAA